MNHCSFLHRPWFCLASGRGGEAGGYLDHKSVHSFVWTNSLSAPLSAQWSVDSVSDCQYCAGGSWMTRWAKLMPAVKMSSGKIVDKDKSLNPSAQNLLPPARACPSSFVDSPVQKLPPSYTLHITERTRHFMIYSNDDIN